MQSTLTPSRRSVRRHGLDRRRIARTPFDFALLFSGVLVLVLLVGVLWWQVWHVNRIFTGVSVAGMPIGGLTRTAAVSQLNRNLIRYPTPPVSITYAGRQWPITSDQMRASADAITAVNQAYLIGREGSISERIGEQLVAALGAIDIVPPMAFDVAQLRYVVGQIANEVRSPARPAGEYGSVTVPAKAGLDVDVEATVQNLVGALSSAGASAGTGRDLSIPLTVIELAPPPVDDSTTGAALSTFESVYGTKPLVLRNGTYGLEFALDPATLQDVVFSTQPLRLDEEKLYAVLTTWAAQIDFPARDARLEFNPQTGVLQVLQPSRFGRRLDVEATANAVEQALAANNPTAALEVVAVAPAVDSNRVAEMGIRELIASGTTYFAGSSLARIRNIEVGAEKFEGVVIPPDGIFSFNELVEDVSAANGFEDSLIIWGDRTAVGIGGGVCQVSTTVFRAAYQAGLPIVERYNHGYVVDWYGEPGLDATIFTPTVDFRFRNDTGAHLLIQPTVNSGQGTITFNLYGTKPARQVTIGEPVTSNVIPAKKPVYRVDESLATGQVKQVEWEKPGMTVTVERTIVEGGVTRTDTLTSVYEPWRAVYLVGPGTDVPDEDEDAETSAEDEPEQPVEPPAAEAAGGEGGTATDGGQ